MKKYNNTLETLAVAAIAVTAPAVADQSLINATGATPTPYITAGNGAGSTDWAAVLAPRIDANVTSSRYTGVVAINPVIDNASFVCTGTAISRRHILTAAHCVDATDQGDVMQLYRPENRINIAFNNDGAYYESGNVMQARSVVIHPDYDGFNVCPDGSAGGVNDDVAIITLYDDIPENVEIYDMYTGSVAATGAGADGDIFNMVGYGTRGDGFYGYYNQYDDPSVSGDIGELGYATFDEKLTGQNIVDFIEGDDESGFGAPAEVWYADFDGYDALFDETINTFCDVDLGVGSICSTSLDESVEANIGGGDSGGPSFIYDALNDKYWLAAINTFGINLGWAPGAFGDLFGGILLESYMGWINGYVAASLAAPTPPALTLMLLGVVAIFARRKMIKA